MSAASIDPQRIERVAKVLTAAMEAGNHLPYSLAVALEVAGFADTEAYPGELAMYRGLVGVLRPVAAQGDMVEVQRLLAEHVADEQAAYTEAAPVTDVAAAVQALGALPMPTGAPGPSPWERAVAGLNALVDAGVAFHVEPDGHISAPFSDEHIEWDLKAKRWVLTHDEDDDSHEAKVAEYLSTPYTDDSTSSEAEALAAIDRSIAAQFPAVTAFLAEDPHDSPLHSSYATPHDLPRLCPSCQEDEATWCPDCGCCRLGCYGGHEDNSCTHPRAMWATS